MEGGSPGQDAQPGPVEPSQPGDVAGRECSHVEQSSVLQVHGDAAAAWSWAEEQEEGWVQGGAHPGGMQPTPGPQHGPAVPAAAAAGCHAAERTDHPAAVPAAGGPHPAGQEPASTAATAAATTTAVPAAADGDVPEWSDQPGAVPAAQGRGAEEKPADASAGQPAILAAVPAAARSHAAERPHQPAAVPAADDAAAAEGCSSRPAAATAGKRGGRR